MTTLPSLITYLRDCATTCERNAMELAESDEPRVQENARELMARAERFREWAAEVAVEVDGIMERRRRDVP